MLQKVDKNKQCSCKSLQDAAAIIQASPDAMLQSDRTGKIILSNPQAEKLFGYSKAEFSTLSIDDLLPDDLRAAHPEKRASYHRDPSVRPMGVSSPNLLAKHKDGSLIPVEIRLAIIRASTGNTSLATIRDITAHKMLEAELREAKRAAEEAASRSAQFLANMSHEIRTPMNGLLCMAELLESADLSEEHSDYLRSIQLSGKTLLVVINDILSYSKLDQGKVELDRRVFNIRNWAEASVLPYRLNVKNNVELNVVIDDRVPILLLGDDVRLQQIIGNLLNNAFKFTGEGSVTLSVQQQSLHENISTLRFEIKDTGIGIPEHVQSVVFEKFEQADRSTTREFGGTGLGLAICKQLVELMAGEIQLESEYGKGTSVLFTLAFDVASQQLGHAHQHEVNTIAISDINVLVVEDNPINQKVVEAMLRRLNIPHLVANNGKQAVDLICQYKKTFDLILMDCEMPIMDGYTATRAIRRWEQTNKIAPTHIVALSAHVLSDQQTLCDEAGMDSSMPKPLSLEALTELVKRVERRTHQ